MSDDVCLFLENILLDFKMVLFLLLLLRYPVIKFDLNVYTHPFDSISVCFYLIIANMALENITGGDSDANFTISMGEFIPTCHWVHPIHITSDIISPNLENIALEIIMGCDCTANVTISSDNL